MSLRQRLALVIVISAVPLVLGLVWARAEFQRRSAETALREFISIQMEGEGRARCEAKPERFPRWAATPPGIALSGSAPGTPESMPAALESPRLELFAYDPDYRSANRAAPPFPGELQRDLDAGQVIVAGPLDAPGGRGVQMAVRMPWNTGACAVIVARLGPPRDSPWAWVASAGAMAAGFVVAVLLAAAPLVRRIRRLTAEVRASASSDYVTPVQGTGRDEIADLAHAFNEAGHQMREQLSTIAERERTLRAFVADTTHDVMTPLTVLQGHLSAMKRSVAANGVTPEQVIATLEESHYLAALIHNLGVAAKLEAGPELAMDPVDANALVERAVARHRPIAEARDIAIDFAVPEQPVRILGDVTLVEQAVSNVIGNAVRYNNPGGHVAVVLEEHGDPPAFRLRVEDDGPGVSAEQLAHLTDRHFRGSDARTRRPDGLGLGLHIAQDVARRHGMTLTIGHSEPGGLEVVFCGPRLDQS